MPLGLPDEVRRAGVKSLNQVLADAISLRHPYNKRHWQVPMAAFYALHLLLDKHFWEQTELVDALAGRIQTLGGVTLAIAEETPIARPPRGREDVPSRLSRLLEAHRLTPTYAREKRERRRTLLATAPTIRSSRKSSRPLNRRLGFPPNISRPRRFSLGSACSKMEESPLSRPSWLAAALDAGMVVQAEIGDVLMPPWSCPAH